MNSDDCEFEVVVEFVIKEVVEVMEGRGLGFCRVEVVKFCDGKFCEVFIVRGCSVELLLLLKLMFSMFSLLSVVISF